MKKIIIPIIVCFVFAFGLTACVQDDVNRSGVSATEILAPTSTETLDPTDTPHPTPSDTPHPAPTKTSSPTAVPSPTKTLSPTPIPGSRNLEEKGVFGVGWLRTEWIDPARNDRVLSAAVYYPADTQKFLDENATPNLEDGPYPLVIFSADMGMSSTKATFNSHLASYGFVVISLGQVGDTFEGMFTERPLDVRFVLDNLDSLLDAELLSIVDQAHVGLMGYLNGGYAVFNAAGAQVDPTYWKANDFGGHDTIIDDQATVSLSATWEDFIAYRSQYGDIDNEELWPGIATVDVDAVLGIFPNELFLFGDRGLESLESPTMIMAGTADREIIYPREIVPFFDPIGAHEKYLITMLVYERFLGDGPSGYELSPLSYTKHFSVAFFGYYLQENSEYLVYFSEDAVNSFEDLHWGIHK